MGEYGKILDIDTSEIVTVAQKMPMPESGSAYDLSIPEFESLAIAEEIELMVFGGIKIQIGYCRGRSKSLDALEWHKNSEVNIAVTEMLLLLGKFYDVEDGRYDSARIKAFRVPQGAASVCNNNAFLPDKHPIRRFWVCCGTACRHKHPA